MRSVQCILVFVFFIALLEYGVVHILDCVQILVGIKAAVGNLDQRHRNVGAVVGNTLVVGQQVGKDKAQLLEAIDASIGLAASALELLSPRADGAILTNIIYYGLPAVLHSVAEGTFRKRSKK